jgi:death-on-curing protein
MEDFIHLSADEIQDTHDSILEDYPGLQGTRPDLSVEALVGRIHTNLAYQPIDTLEDIAALYAEVIARGHVFLDGNKRTALVSMLNFLDINGYTLEAGQIVLADKMVDVTEGRLGYKQFALWLKPKLRPNE